MEVSTKFMEVIAYGEHMQDLRLLYPNLFSNSPYRFIRHTKFLKKGIKTSNFLLIDDGILKGLDASL